MNTAKVPVCLQSQGLLLQKEEAELAFHRDTSEEGGEEEEEEVRLATVSLVKSVQMFTIKIITRLKT